MDSDNTRTISDLKIEVALLKERDIARDAKLDRIERRMDDLVNVTSDLTQLVAEFKGGKAALFKAFAMIATLGAGLAWFYTNFMGRK